MSPRGLLRQPASQPTSPPKQPFGRSRKQGQLLLSEPSLNSHCATLKRGTQVSTNHPRVVLGKENHKDCTKPGPGGCHKWQAS
jgi:hypothetical protein